MTEHDTRAATVFEYRVAWKQKFRPANSTPPYEAVEYARGFMRQTIENAKITGVPLEYARIESRQVVSEWKEVTDETK